MRKQFFLTISLLLIGLIATGSFHQVQAVIDPMMPVVYGDPPMFSPSPMATASPDASPIGDPPGSPMVTPSPMASASPNASLTPSPFASPSPTSYPSAPINWTTNYNSLISPHFTIVTPNGAFVGSMDQLEVHADRGDANYQSLETTWHENGVEMRMNIYLAQQDGYWRVTEFRTYDGAADGEWIYYDGTPFGVMPVGNDFVTDHFSFPSRDGRGRVIMDNVVMKAFLNHQIDGDLNNDGKVNLLDYSILVADLFKTGANLPADINQDGKVNLLDYSILVSNLSL